TKQEKQDLKGLYLSDPEHRETHYSIYEDEHGTHIFATDDINLLPYLDQLMEIGLTRWKLDGIFTSGDRFVDIVRLFVEAKQLILKNEWNEKVMNQLNEQLIALHPQERSLNTGFFLKNPNEIQ